MRIKSTLLLLLPCAFLLSACVIDEEESYSNTYPNYSQQTTRVYQNNDSTYPNRPQQARVYNNQGGYRTTSNNSKQTQVHIPVNAYRSNHPMAQQTPSYQTKPQVKMVQNDANSQATQTHSNSTQDNENGGVSLR